MSSLEYAEGRQHPLRGRQDLCFLFFCFGLFLGDVKSLYIYILQCNYMHNKPTIGLTPKNGIQSQPREEKLTSVIDSSSPNGRKREVRNVEK